jgi:hypothetical protein
MSSGVATPARRLAQGCAPSRTRMPPNVQSFAAIWSLLNFTGNAPFAGCQGGFARVLSSHRRGSRECHPVTRASTLPDRGGRR